MNEIEKVQPMMPMLPEIMGSVIPVQNPQIDWGTGLIGGFFHKQKVKQRAEIAEYEADISVAKTRNASALMQMMFEMQTYGPKVQDFYHETEHRKAMRNIEKETAQATLINMQLKNVQLQVETELTKLELKHKIKELGENGYAET